jgi:hypothetical protein
MDWTNNCSAVMKESTLEKRRQRESLFVYETGPYLLPTGIHWWIKTIFLFFEPPRIAWWIAKSWCDGCQKNDLDHSMVFPMQDNPLKDLSWTICWQPQYPTMRVLCPALGGIVANGMTCRRPHKLLVFS